MGRRNTQRYDPTSDPIYGSDDLQLDFEVNEIRLFLLEPGAWNDEICGSLLVVGLDEKPRFTAISYFWGRGSDGGPKRRIRIEKNELEIPVNLFTGLRRARDEKEVLILWADAICINQKDQIELNDQVARMAQLYRQCEGVRVFLDDDTHTNDVSVAPELFEWKTKDAANGHYVVESKNKSKTDSIKRGMLTYNQLPKALRHRSDQDPILGAFCLISLLAKNKHFNSDDIRLLPSNRTRYNCLMKLRDVMNLPWWRRQWVVQETVFGRSVSLQYKGFICPWEMFALAATNYREHIKTCCSTEYAELPPSELESLELFTRTVTDLDYWRRVWEKEDIGPIKNKKINLLQLLRQFRTRDTSVPKDKIYALIPLVNDWDREDPIKITYSFSDESVFRDVVNKMISVCKDLSVLMGSTGQFEESIIDPSVPSWITDWASLPEPRELERLLRTKQYQASGEYLIPQWRILPGLQSEQFLELEGFTHDVVTEVAEVMPYEDDNAISDMFRKWEMFLKLHESPHATYRDGTKLCDAYWRTLCMDSIYEGKGAETDTPLLARQDYRRLDTQDHSYQRWMELIETMNSEQADQSKITNGTSKSPPPSPPGIDSSGDSGVDNGVEADLSQLYNYQIQIDEAIASATACRKLFKTKNGYIGLGPSRTDQGDEIWILSGGDMPFLLRPSGDREFKRGFTEKKPCHRLVGDCYVHGIMYGEAMKENGSKAMDQVWLL